MNDWKQQTLSQNLPCVRTGWIGVWDAIKRAFGQPAVTLATPHTLSCWVKCEYPVGMTITATQMEKQR